MSDACAWRAQLFRVLYPHSGNTDREPASKAMEATLDGIQEACRNLAKAFLFGPMMALISSSPGDEHLQAGTELLDIYVQAGKLFTRLQTRRSEMSQMCTRHLGKVFDPSTMQPHSLRRIYEDEYDTLAGKRVNIVVSPTVWARGVDGEDYSKPYVLVKAIVWLDD